MRSRSLLLVEPAEPRRKSGNNSSRTEPNHSCGVISAFWQPWWLADPFGTFEHDTDDDDDDADARDVYHNDDRILLRACVCVCVCGLGAHVFLPSTREDVEKCGDESCESPVRIHEFPSSRSSSCCCGMNLSDENATLQHSGCVRKSRQRVASPVLPTLGITALHSFRSTQ